VDCEDPMAPTKMRRPIQLSATDQLLKTKSRVAM
jgi:hypothetical protein